MKKLPIVLFIAFLCLKPVRAQLRTFDTIFPNIEKKAEIFSPHGLVQSERISSLSLLDASIAEPVLARNFSVMTEALAVIQKQTDCTRLYNALGNIRGLNGRIYQKPAGSENYFYLFDDISRTNSDLAPIADPVPAAAAPTQDTFYIRLKDNIFGYSYYRVDMTSYDASLLYTITNYRSLYYYFVPVIGRGGFTARLYLELIDKACLPTALRASTCLT